MKPFDIEKAKAGDSVVTADGRDVEILTYTRNHPRCPIVALVGDKGGVQQLRTYQLDGSYVRSTCATSEDLRMLPTKHTRMQYMNVYPDYVITHNSPESAGLEVSPDCLAIAVPINIEWET